MKYLVSLSVIILVAVNVEKLMGGSPEYTPEEKAALEKFKKSVDDVTYKEYMKLDHYLIRWLRAAKDLNLDEASQLLRTAITWRKENKIDGILDETIHDFTKPPFYMDAVDKEGSIVFVLMASRLNLRKFISEGKQKEVVRYLDKLLEMLETKSLELLGVIGNANEPDRKRADQFTTIIDFKGYDEAGCTPCVKVYLEWLEHIEKYYPGYLKHFIMINTSRETVPLIKPLEKIMSPATKNVYRALREKEEWMPVLHEIIEPDQIRANLGGTKSE